MHGKMSMVKNQLEAAPYLSRINFRQKNTARTVSVCSETKYECPKN